jgi:hypothetical protein
MTRGYDETCPCMYCDSVRRNREEDKNEAIRNRTQTGTGRDEQDRGSLCSGTGTAEAGR